MRQSYDAVRISVTSKGLYTNTDGTVKSDEPEVLSTDYRDTCGGLSTNSLKYQTELFSRRRMNRIDTQQLLAK